MDQLTRRSRIFGDVEARYLTGRCGQERRFEAGGHTVIIKGFHSIGLVAEWGAATSRTGQCVVLSAESQVHRCPLAQKCTTMRTTLAKTNPRGTEGQLRPQNLDQSDDMPLLTYVVAIMFEQRDI